MTFYGEIFKSLIRKFLSRHRLMLLCSKFVKFVRPEIREIVRYLVDKKNKILSASQTVATALIAPRASPQQSAPDFNQIG